MSLSKNLKKRRLELNLTLEELANKIGTTRQTIQRYESGDIKNIPTDKVEKLAEALETTPVKLMGWEYYDIKYPNVRKEYQEYEKKLNHNEEKLLTNFKKLNDLGQQKAIENIQDLTEIDKYTNEYEIETVAAHNDFLDEHGEMDNIYKDIEKMKKW